MKIDRKMLVKKTTRILPPFEMPLPPAQCAKVFLVQLSNYSEIFKEDFDKIFPNSFPGERKKKRRRKEKEKGEISKSSKDKDLHKF